MKITYDKEADALYIKITDKKVVESEEISENFVLDFDEDKNVVGIEIIYFVAKHKKEVLSALKLIEEATKEN